MANIKAQASGNWSATATWAGGVVPVAGDAVWANNFTITLNQDINVASLNTTAVTGITFNGGTTSANAGGGFNAGNLVANITVVDITAGTSNCLSVQNTNSSLNITSTGNINGSSVSSTLSGIVYAGIGTCVINALNINSGTGVGSSGTGIAISGSATSNVTITGNAFARNASAMQIGGSGVSTFTGTLNFAAGAVSSMLSINTTGTTTINADMITPAAFGLSMVNATSNTGTINIVGTIQANTSISNIICVANQGTATMNITGNCTGGANGSYAVNNNSTGINNK
jgi:hypothetical protein